VSGGGPDNEAGKLPDSSPAKRIEQHQWKKGQSGNPAGRPKGSGSLLKALQDKLSANDGLEAKKFVDRMFEIAQDDPALAVKIFKDMADRTEGTAIKRKEITVKDHSKLVVLEDESDDEEENEDGEDA
jgi:hypothetical protein